MSQELLPDQCQDQDPDLYQGRDPGQDQFQSHLYDHHLQLDQVRDLEVDLPKSTLHTTVPVLESKYVTITSFENVDTGYQIILFYFQTSGAIVPLVIIFRR